MKLEISNRRKTHNIWKLKNNNNNKPDPGITQWIKEEIKRKLKKYCGINKNGSTIYQNLQDTAKAVLREKFITINIDFKEKEYIDPKLAQGKK